MHSLLITRIDADAVNTVTIKVKVWIDFSQMTLKYQTLHPHETFSPSIARHEVNTCTMFMGAAAVYNVRKRRLLQAKHSDLNKSCACMFSSRCSCKIIIMISKQAYHSAENPYLAATVARTILKWCLSARDRSDEVVRWKVIMWVILLRLNY